MPGHLQPVVAFFDIDLQIELDRQPRVDQTVDRQAWQQEIRCLAGHGQQQLHQWRMGATTTRLQLLQQHLEGQILVRDRLYEVALALVQQRVKARAAINLATQQDGVDEKANRSISIPVCPAGHREADHYVAFRRIQPHQCRKRHMHEGSQRGVLRLTTGAYRAERLTADVPVHLPARVRLNGRPRPIQRQAVQLRQAFQFTQPIGQVIRHAALALV
ncbi:hypothetical protein D3C71_990240 [compost metagenome]